MLRSVASSLLSFVMTATLMWGGCVSCDQYFMFPGKQQPCCNKAGKCERPGKNQSTAEKRDCNRLPFDRVDNAHAVPTPAVLPARTVPAFQEASARALLHFAAFDVLVDPSPPNLQAINVTFLI